MATYWENSCSFGLRYVSWYMYLIVGLVFSHLGFWSGNLFLIAPFPDLCLLVPFSKLLRDKREMREKNPNKCPEILTHLTCTHTMHLFNQDYIVKFFIVFQFSGVENAQRKSHIFYTKPDLAVVMF